MLSFACPMIGLGGMNLISTTSASFFYTDILRLSAKTVGNVQLTLMFTYAFSEPIFGWFSDKSSGKIIRKYGKRKPFLFVSSIFQASTLHKQYHNKTYTALKKQGKKIYIYLCFYSLLIE